MIRIPERALVIRKDRFAIITENVENLGEAMAFDAPFAESEDLVVYGPYFDFVSLDEVGRRLGDLGLVYWEDFFEFKEDVPKWVVIAAMRP